MKKVFLFLFSCMLLSMNTQAQNVMTSKVELDHDEIVLAVGLDTALVAKVLPSNATNKAVTWSILEQGQLIIDTLYTLQDTICRIKAISVGTAKIAVITKDGNFRDTCVIRAVIPVTGISLDDDTIKIIRDRDSVLIATVSPFDATDKSIQWTNSDPTVVSFEIEDDSICYLRSLKEGKALIYAITIDGGLKDSCVIEVSARPVESLTLSEDSIDMFIGSDGRLTAHLEPKSGIDKSVNWISLHPGIVELTSEGRDTIYEFHAKAVGEAKIVAKSAVDELITDTCVITVHGIPAEAMSLNYDTLVMYVNTDTLLIANILPYNTTNKRVVWASADSAIVDITSDPLAINDTVCVISALKAGTTKIAAKTFDGEFPDTCVVRVIVPVDSLVMRADSITLSLDDDPYELKVIIYPDSATFKTLRWTVSNPSIADTVYTENDTVAFIQANKAGIAYVYATTLDGLQKDSCVVTVDSMHVSDIRLNTGDSLDLYTNDVYRLKATILPANASDQTIRWTSTDSSVVDIPSTENDSICNIKALKTGKAIIYAVTNDGGKKDSCVVTVRLSPVTGIRIIGPDSMATYLDNEFYEHTYYLEAALIPDLGAVNSHIEWTSSDSGIVDLKSMSIDTIHQLIPVSAGMAKIYVRAIGTNFKDSCVVTVREQSVALETDTAAALSNQNGTIEVLLIVPENDMLGGSFELQLPEGFGLAKDDGGYKTILDDGIKDDYDLSVNYVNDSTYLFEVNPVDAASIRVKPRSGATLLKLMDIEYTIYRDALFGSKADYIAKLIDVAFTFSDDVTLVDNRIEITIKSYKDPTGNIVIVKPAVLSYIRNDRLYVNSDKAETIYVYSVNGQLLFTGKKSEGQAVFDLNTPEKMLIVRGNSGWANKVANP